MPFNKYFLRSALPTAKFTNISCDDFFENNKITGFSIDSRTIQPGEFFIALRGERVDGHDFVAMALQNGAAGLIIQNNIKIDPSLLKNKLIVLVKDSFNALINLAKIWRARFDYPVVGITGSVGKTTTKEMLANILRTAKINACISLKNQNTNIGLCLNILKMRKKHSVAIFEMGINAVGEMEALADLLRPNIALITQVSPSHAQGLGSIAQIAKQKIQIFKFFNPNNLGIVFGDQPFLSDFNYSFPLMKFGFKIKNHINARQIKVVRLGDQEFKTTFNLKIYNKKQKMTLSGNHLGFVHNAMAASTLAVILKVEPKDIAVGLQTFKSFENRFEKKKIKNGAGVIISDCYNANPESMKAAILAFGQMKSCGPKVAVLGDMLELGQREMFWHRQIGRVLRKSLGLDFVILVGKLAKQIAKTAPHNLKFACVDDWKMANQKLNQILLNNSKKESLVLIKASRGMQLDKIVKELSC